MKVSIVIPAYNEEKYIRFLLNSLSNQVSAVPFEIIIVDNHSTDNTKEVIGRYKEKLDIKYIFETEKGRGSARSTGFSHATGDVILSTDADSIVPCNWVSDMYKFFINNSDIVAVTGTAKIHYSLVVDFIFNTFQPVSMKIYNLFFHHYWLSGFNFGIRKKAYQESGGFSRNLNVQEDIDLSFRVQKKGIIKFLPDLPVVVSARRFRNGIFHGTFGYIHSFTSYYWFKRKDMILNDPR